MTTRLRPYAGPGLVHFVSTLVVCGVAVLIAPPVAAASVTVDVSLVAGAAVSADQTSTDHAWSAEVIAPDVPDSSDDDDGGDDAPGASAAIAPASLSSHNSCGDNWYRLHILVISCASRTGDGHSLRGPPCVTGDASSVDQSDCLAPPVAAPYPHPLLGAASAEQTSTGHEWSADTISPDVPDSSDDDDGGDDAPGASAAVVQASLSSHNSGGDRWHLLHTLMVSCASQTRDGHSLRGPPYVTGDASDVDEDDCGHDQDMTPFTAAPPYSNPFRRFPGNSLLSGACDGPSMRAP